MGTSHCFSYQCDEQTISPDLHCRRGVLRIVRAAQHFLATRVSQFRDQPACRFGKAVRFDDLGKDYQRVEVGHEKSQGLGPGAVAG